MTTIFKTQLFIVCASLALCSLQASESQQYDELDFQLLYREANEASAQQKDYAGALEKYLEILEKRGPSTEVLLSISNAYFKSDQLGEALLYIERANLLDPHNPDIKNNRQVIRKRLSLDDSAEPGFWETLVSKANQRQWFIAFAIVFNLPILVSLIRLFANKTGARATRAKQFPLVAYLPAWLIAAGLLGIALKSASRFDHGVVLNDQSRLLQSPFESAEELAEIGIGFELKTLDEHESFYLVQTLDGLQKGWISKKDFGTFSD